MIGCFSILEKSTFGADQQLGRSLTKISFLEFQNQMFNNSKMGLRIKAMFYYIICTLLVSYNLLATSEPPKYSNSPNLCFDSF